MKRGTWHMYYQIKQGRMRGREIHKMRARKPRDKIQDEMGGEMKAAKCESDPHDEKVVTNYYLI